MIEYRKGSWSQATDFLCRVSIQEEEVEGMDEEDSMRIVASEDVDASYTYDLEPALQETAKCLAECSMKNCTTSKERASICRRSLKHV